MCRTILTMNLHVSYNVHAPHLSELSSDLCCSYAALKGKPKILQVSPKWTGHVIAKIYKQCLWNIPSEQYWQTVQTQWYKRRPSKAFPFSLRPIVIFTLVSVLCA